jgi:MOSC domain-containing protein
VRVAVEVIARSEPAQKGAERGEAEMRRIGPVVNAARRSVRHQDVDEAAAANAVSDQPRNHPQDREPHVEFARLERAVVIARGTLETADEHAVHRDDSAMEVDALPPDSDLAVVETLGRHVVVPVYGAQRRGYPSRDEVKVVVRQVAASQDEIDQPGALVQGGSDCLIFDIADGEDAHALSVSLRSFTRIWKTRVLVNAHVAWIHVAPIKALAIQELRQVKLSLLGVENDRRFCIVDPEGRMLNAKRVQRFVSVRPHFDDSMRELVLGMPDGSEARGTIEFGHPITVAIYGRGVPARIVDGPWSDALSALAERPVRLVRFDEPGEGVDRADEGAGASLLSEGSLRAIAQAAGVTAPVDPRRFRMLFGIAGVDPHAEDTWMGMRVHIGSAVVVPGGNIGRCAVTTLDPTRGVSDLDTLAALAKYRGEKITSEPLAFGVWAQVVRPGLVRIGDAVHVA